MEKLIIFSLRKKREKSFLYISNTGYEQQQYSLLMSYDKSQHIEYFAFGETFVEEHRSSNYSPYKFNGKELDEKTGWYYYGARYYDQIDWRFDATKQNLIDPTGDIVYGYALGGDGSKALGFIWGKFVSYTGFPKQWIRLGPSYSHAMGEKTSLSLRWGAGGNHWQKIGSPTLQNWNKTFRTTKFPINN